MPPILVLSDLAFAYGERVLFEGLSMALEPGDKIGLIGDNGVGKSSLLRLVLGEERPLRGDIALRNGARVGVLEQVPVIAPERTVRDVLEEGLKPLIDAIAAWESAVGAMSDKADALMTTIENLGGFDYEHKIQDIAAELDLPPLDRTIGTLSGGQGKRVAIGRLVLSNPDVVLLDEPTNHLDIETVEWLEKWISESPSSCLVVTHDRTFLDNAVTKMAELRSVRRMSGPDASRGPLGIYNGNYEDYLEARAVEEEQRAALGQSRAQQLKGELEWSRRMPKARTVKSAARMGRVEALVGEVRDLKQTDVRANFDLGQGAPRLARNVVRLEGATFGYGDPATAKPLARKLDFALVRGERLGVIGANGIGKTSLLKVISGELGLWEGTRDEGPETRVATFDQHRTVLDPTRSIQLTIAPDGNDIVFPGGKPMHVAGWLARFAFTAKHLPMNVSALSGGERNRLAMARFLLEPANVLLLDEPTNDLDLATLAVLEEALLGFAGTVVVVSHDRWFLDRVATRLLVFEDLPPERVGGETRRNLFIQPGGWTHYRRLRGPELDAMRTAHNDAKKAQAKADKAGNAKPLVVVPKTVPLSGPEKKELQKLEGVIAKLEAELALLAPKLLDASAWAGDGRDGWALSARKTAVEAELETVMARWTVLAEKT